MVYEKMSNLLDAYYSKVYFVELMLHYPDIEYIIVDGASKDGSVEAIREAIAGHEDKVKFISEPDHGMYEAINKGIRMATGDYIGLVHSDDFLYSSHTISDIVKKLKETNADVLYGDRLFVNPENTGKVVRKRIGGTYRLWEVPQFIKAKFM